MEEAKLNYWLNQLKDVSDFVLITILKERADEKVREVWKEEEILEETIPLKNVSEGFDIRNIGEVKKKWPAKCTQCGCQTEVPFEPRYNSPIYCPECYKNKGGRR